VRRGAEDEDVQGRGHRAAEGIGRVRATTAALRATLPAMVRSRRLAILLSAAALAAPAAAIGQGTSGAGDDQYEDPFAGGGTTNGQTTTGSQTPSSGGSTLTQDPDLGGETSTGATSGTTGTPASTGATSGTLPNTGSDPRLLILAGLALLLSGFGLRLRTADEIF